MGFFITNNHYEELIARFENTSNLHNFIVYNINYKSKENYLWHPLDKDQNVDLH